MSGIPINSGTGPSVAATLVGTDYVQLVAISGGITATAPSANPLFVTGSVAVGVTTLTATTGTFSITGVVGISGTNTALQGGTWNIATITTLLGTIAVSGGGGGVQYSIGDTSMAATGTGTLVLGMQTGATTGRGIAITTTGAQYVVFPAAQIVTAANVTIASITTGTMNVINVLSASGVTIASVTTGTMNVVNVLSASGVTIASMTTGTVNVVNTVAISGSASIINTVAISGSVTPIGTGNFVLVTTAKNLAGGVVSTAHASQFQAFVLATTSAAAGVIVKTSGGTTLYITDVLISVSGPMNVLLCSETTTMAGPIYLATNGGWVQDYVQPLICTTAQSLRIILSSSGSCSVNVCGYTVV